MKRKRALLFTITVVLVLCAACGVWLHVQKQQYARNRALIDALTHNDTRTALALVNTGADPNTRLNPLPAPTLKLFIDHLMHHAPPPANDSPTVFMLACGNGWNQTNRLMRYMHIPAENLPLLQAMLAHGANVNARDWDNRMALDVAIRGGRSSTVELLVQHGADVNAQNERGQTPLMMAEWNGTANVAHLLLAHGANPNVQEQNGFTALHNAFMSPIGISLLPDLLAHGADPNLPAKNGQTPLQMAQQGKRPDLVRLLKGGAGR